MDNLTIIIAIIGALTVCTNVITEVLKSSFPKLPAQITATVIAMTLTVASFFGYAAYTDTTITWYMVLGAVVGGFFVSYAAQFGYDKLIEVVKRFKEEKKWQLK